MDSLPHILHEKRHGEPLDWKRDSRAHGEHVLPVRIGLRQRNLEHAERFLSDVADPESGNFGRW